MGRNKVYENPAERRAAYLATKARFDLLTDKTLGDTVREIAEIHEASTNQVLTAMIRFASTNHNWRREMLWALTDTK